MSSPQLSGPILVTGGAGFIGGYIVRNLIDRGYEVLILDAAPYRPAARFVIGSACETIPFVQASIQDAEAISKAFETYKPRAVIHVASVMDLGYLDAHPMVALEVNVRGALNILEAARISGTARVVCFSSIAVIPQPLYQPMDANHPTIQATAGPLGMYGAAKLSIEGFAAAYTEIFGLDTRILRPSAVYGFGMSWEAANYMKQIVEPAVLGTAVDLPHGGPVPRDYTHARDIARLSVAILEGPDSADRIFFGATGQPLHTASEVAALVRELIPGSSVSIADRWGPEDLAEKTFRGLLSIDNARRQLGWSPEFTDLRTGIADYIDTLRRFIAAGNALDVPASGRP
jgi:nucleoside-diphosphate-sugar epimerase